MTRNLRPDGADGVADCLDGFVRFRCTDVVRGGAVESPTRPAIRSTRHARSRPARARPLRDVHRAPSPTGPVLRIGPDDAAVDMGHLGEEYGYTNCFRLAQQAVRA